MTKHCLHFIMVAVLSVVGGCSAYDPYIGTGTSSSGSYPASGSSTAGASNGGTYYPNTTYNHSNNNYPYNANYVSNNYPSNGYEVEYRKAKEVMDSKDAQAIINNITQRMINSGWYPEGVQGNQMIFTNVRNVNGQRVYYKTVYTLSPTSSGYVVYANMKLKTTDSPYNGSLDDAARNVDDKTENILRSVRKVVEQIVTTPTPLVQNVARPISVSQPMTQSINQSSAEQYTTSNKAISSSIVKPQMNLPITKTMPMVSEPNNSVTPISPTPVTEVIEEMKVAKPIRATDEEQATQPQTRREKRQETTKQLIQNIKKDKHKSTDENSPEVINSDDTTQ